jgi:hypothetical protein
LHWLQTLEVPWRMIAFRILNRFVRDGLLRFEKSNNTAEVV